jgi:arsenate reductase (thioredoxin)
MTARATPYNVLFLCTGNSARSILGEAITNQIGADRFKGFSAGPMPKGAVHPQALDLLKSKGVDVSGFRSKPWDEFSAPGSPRLDFVITVCGNAAGEVCPLWPGQPITAHWGMPDPAAVDGGPAAIALAFADTWRMLMNRIRLFTSLPVESLDRLAIKQRMDDIGHTAPAPA